jgi:nucleotide-binding universal stress UspA family protein
MSIAVVGAPRPGANTYITGLTPNSRLRWWSGGTPSHEKIRSTKEAKEYGLETEIEVVRDANWRERIATTARDSSADLVVKTVSRHAGLARQLKATTDCVQRALAEATRKLAADILVIGCANRHLGGSGTIIGDMARRIIDAVDTDLVVIPNA